MKVNLLKINSMRATALLILSTFFAINVMAQNTSVSITVNQVPVLTVGDDAPDAVCPDANTTYINEEEPDPTHTFDAEELISLAGITTTPSDNVTIEFASAVDNYVTWTDAPSYTVDAGATLAIKVRAYMTDQELDPCYSAEISFTVAVKEFSALTITGDPTVCGAAVATYGITTTGTVTDYLWTIIPGTDGGTGVITGGTTATLTITWDDNNTGENQTATLQLVYTVDGCSYTVTQEITIQSRPAITIDASATTALCYPASGTIDLTQYVNVTNGNEEDVLYSTTEDFTTETTFSATAATTFDISSFAAAGGSEQIWVKIANEGECASNVEDFTLTIYAQITAELVIKDGDDETEYEACANSDGTTPTTVTMELTIGGGCPTTGDNHSYSVVLNNTLVDTDGNAIAIDLVSGATISGNTLTIPVAEGAASVTVTLTVDIPATGGTGSVEVDTVTQTGTEPCDCTRSTWN